MDIIAWNILGPVAGAVAGMPAVVPPGHHLITGRRSNRRAGRR
ncbi:MULTISPECIES: hypothetical protein [unclassified Nonomuraea]